MLQDPPQDTPRKTTVHSLYHAGSTRRVTLIVALIVIVVASAILAAGIGTVAIAPGDTILALIHVPAVAVQDFLVRTFPSGVPVLSGILVAIPAPSDTQAELIVMGFRMPRIFLAILTGASLAVAGVVMQGLLRNPLVSPFTLGLSSAASFGAAVAIVIGPAIVGTFAIVIGPAIVGTFAIGIGDDAFIIVMAFLFGWLSMLLVYGISRARGTSQSTLILSGVVIGYLFQAGVMALKYTTNNDKLRDIVVWLMGGMWGASWNAVLILLPLCLVTFIVLERMAWDLNALAAGDDVAKNLGINVGRFRLVGLMVATFAASCCLAFTGIIGFIGLMAPHICRMFIGNDHRYLIPCSALMGAAILLISDTVARTIMSPVEIPVGIIMYIIGGIFFLFLILRGQGRGLY
ncbi:MAG: iron ABC transporter permease [Methanoregula sp.]|nr:iron ABC transporter permease [Methanoregula sp.]